MGEFFKYLMMIDGFAYLYIKFNFIFILEICNFPWAWLKIKLVEFSTKGELIDQFSTKKKALQINIHPAPLFNVLILFWKPCLLLLMSHTFQIKTNPILVHL